jgi:predicted dehydrogenase/threonine dehydrogenase-like Zn-dependent dehydrogenase
MLIRTTRSLISAGTERMLVDFGKAGLIEKARQQPDKVRMVLDKVRTDGLMPTLDAVRNKLDQPIALGYCNVGRVIEVGRNVTGFAVGDRVASNGKHAEVVSVATNLCARLRDDTSDEAATFMVLGAIALQGIRLAQPTLGETIVVSGLGLIGLVAVQLLRANGCRVIGLDFDAARLALARQFGADVIDLGKDQDPARTALALTQGQGVDAVIVTAATKSSEPMHQAAQMCRKRGRIVLVGVTGLELSRADFYEKELTFQVSCSYGPGRYDPNYEQKGLDYPIGFVRWTEQRNFEALLDLITSGHLQFEPLISHRFGIDDAAAAYEVIGGKEPSLGVMLVYPDVAKQSDAILRKQQVSLTPAQIANQRSRHGEPSIGVIGAGNYATGVLIPAFKTAGAKLRTVASSTGVSGVHAGRKFGFEGITTDVNSMLEDDQISTIVITTRHDTHAALVVKALDAGKHVFVEKPLALKVGEIVEIEAALERASRAGRPQHLMVGFNRRFAPLVVKAKALLAGSPGPRAMVMTVNAGAIPPEHWTQDPETGGGRIIGEACHFIDLLRHLADAPIIGHSMTMMDSATNDTATIQLSFANGSIGTVHYFANGHKGTSKERLDIFDGGRVLHLDNFIRLTGHGWSTSPQQKLWRQDKGQTACVQAFIDSIKKGRAPTIALAEILEVSRVTLAVAGQVRSG